MYDSFLVKYKPVTLEEFRLNATIIEFINKLLLPGGLSIIVSGVSGVGKTCMINHLVSQYYNGYSQIESNILILNCLKDTSILYYKTDVKQFCQTKTCIQNKKKIIILDDFDHANEQCQQVINTYIESYSDNVMFVISATDTDKVVGSAKIVGVRLNEFQRDFLLDKFNYIVEQESLMIDNNCIDTILKLSNKSIKQLINTLEKIKHLGVSIDDTNVYFICSNINFRVFENYTNAIICGEFKRALNEIKHLIEEGYSIYDIYYYYYAYIKNVSTLDNKSKLQIINKLCKFNAINSANENILQIGPFTRSLIECHSD